MTTETLAHRIDISDADQVAALCAGCDVSRESIEAVVAALRPVAGRVRFYAMTAAG